MRTGDGFICVYSITQQNSFDEAVQLHSHILRVKDEDRVPFVLVGNKCDLEEEREVTYEKGQTFANELKCPFLEASAKTRKNVVETFEAIVREINKNRNNVSPVTDESNSNASNKPGRARGNRPRKPCTLL